MNSSAVSKDRQQPDVLIIGAGMITHDLILPSLYHLQRIGEIGEITVCATSSRNIRILKESPEIREAFPQQDFRAMPSIDTPVGPPPGAPPEETGRWERM